ncbi:peptidylprolyl isomerase [Reichenbachiella carrageenanivorans]|uniref:Peptidylprolyl isomerase n=1 Tax=Reichenbachiella carrageenanivorans TaxID=2979869 RepID=A0ABY6D3U8_9BACT|nr:peptidylprolyl isomerase [Reichenbachiella carrageenanivorans]UXX80464.1 peptidylprolyl isomerase [Reichenbachiella carrageenanivorans]
MNLNYIKLGLIAVLMSVMGQAQAQSAGDKGVVIDKIIAKVDDYIVLKSELDRAYLEFLSRGELSQGDPKCQILESLVINKMMVAKAEIDSIYVLDAEVENNLDRRMSYFIQQIGSEERLEEIYNKSISEFKADLFDQIKEQMIVQKMQGTIGEDVSVTPAEVKKFYGLIPRDSLPYFSTEVTIGQIVKIPDVNDKRKEEIENQMLDLKKRIENGEDFGQLAKKFSQDPGSASAGGELGFFKRGELAPEYEAAALSMKPGEISRPVESQFGFHLIQLIERRGNTYNSRHILIIPKATTSDVEDAKQFLDSLRSAVINDSMRFEVFAKEHSDDQQTSGNGGFFSDATGAMKVSVEELDPTLFFTIDTMAVGSITRPMEFRMADGTDAVRIILYKEKIPPHQANLLQDYQKIRAATVANKRNQIMSDWFQETQGEVYIHVDPEFEKCRILVN